MKKDIHPQVNSVVFVDTSCGVEFVTTSTLSSDRTREINGVSHFIIPIEISSASHPFYTGKQMLIRRVEKFEERMKKQEKVAAKRKGKKTKHAVRAAKEKTEDTEKEA